jgi:hypothetical protein
MSPIQIITALFVTFLFALRPFVYRPCATSLSTKTSATFTGLWMFIGVLVTLPFYKHMLYNNGEFLFSYDIIVYSIIKGYVLWFSVRLFQKINMESISSSVLSGPIATGVAVLLNVMVFHEQLTIGQFVSIFSIGVIGSLFFIFGHAKSLSKRAKKFFLISIFLTSYCIVSDQIVITQTNWYVHIFFTSLAFFLTSITSRVSKEEWLNCFRKRKSIVAGLTFACGEFYLMSVLVVILPVSLGSLAVRMAIPFIMITSAIVYHETKWQKQALFSIMLLLSIIPLILF